MLFPWLLLLSTEVSWITFCSFAVKAAFRNVLFSQERREQVSQVTDSYSVNNPPMGEDEWNKYLKANQGMIKVI